MKTVPSAHQEKDHRIRGPLKTNAECNSSIKIGKMKGGELSLKGVSILSFLFWKGPRGQDSSTWGGERKSSIAQIKNKENKKPSQKHEKKRERIISWKKGGIGSLQVGKRKEGKKFLNLSQTNGREKAKVSRRISEKKAKKHHSCL